MRAWEAIEKLLTEGRSWSGRERNCCFLNCGGQRFADVSAVTGLDLEHDSRGVGIVDWDQDGDLDLWISNRTGPRLSFLKNQSQAGDRFLALRFVGVSCNRDAIGARVEVIARDGSAHRRVRTLRAGEGYLSQSSKWLHFGLGETTAIDRVVVRWPGGDVEELRGLEAGRWYELVQGSGAPRPWTPPRRSVRLTASEPGSAPRPGSVRVVPHDRLPLPRLEYVDLSGATVSIVPAARGPVLVALWATWCSPCLKELKDLGENRDRLRAAGVEILPLSVDDLDADWGSRKSKVEPVLTGTNAPWRGGLATATLVERLNAVQRTLLSKKAPLPVPSAFLIDARGRLAVVYRGRVPLARLLEDTGECVRGGKDARDAALPFPGRWYVNPFGADLLAIPRELLEVSDSIEALDYLIRHVAADRESLEAARAVSGALNAGTLAETYLDVGVRLAKEGHGEQAVDALRKAVSFDAGLWAAQVALAEALQRQGNAAGTLAQYRKMLEQRPGDPAASNNLAWILATRPDSTMDDAREAIQHALRLCEATRYQVPSAVDTLAAGYAAAGQFAEAAAAAEKAIALAAATGQHELAAKIRDRLRSYQAQRPYREGPGAK
ncbi:MAG: ASPIC/UnbV domain-containing protein [Planctomycetes bacterium]|nr:ASPIC/UnbV domain-containing protein [Planctomycetota bacterium]